MTVEELGRERRDLELFERLARRGISLTVEPRIGEHASCLRNEMVQRHHRGHRDAGAKEVPGRVVDDLLARQKLPSLTQRVLALLAKELVEVIARTVPSQSKICARCLAPRRSAQ